MRESNPLTPAGLRRSQVIAVSPVRTLPTLWCASRHQRRTRHGGRKGRHVGDLVACVAAVDEATALRHSRSLTSSGKNLNRCLTRKRPRGPRRTHPLAWQVPLSRTNVQKRVSKNSETVLVSSPHASLTARGPCQVHHGFTEPHAVVAHWDPNGRLQLYTPQQVPHYTHRACRPCWTSPCTKSTSSEPSSVAALVGNQTPSLTRCAPLCWPERLDAPSALPLTVRSLLDHRGRHPSHIDVKMTADTRVESRL